MQKQNEEKVNISVSKPLGALLISLRKEKGLSQEQMAKKLGVKRATISAYETGRIIPPPEKLHEIALFFEVNEERLFMLITGEAMGKNSFDTVDDWQIGDDFLKYSEEMPGSLRNALYRLVSDLYKEGHCD